jgi:hypothetical protein
LNATFGPAISPPTNSATNTAAASKLPAIMLKKTDVAIVVSHFTLLHNNSSCKKRFLRYERNGMLA